MFGVILKLLGREDVKDTIVGDAVLRGVSGVQKKRVTLGDIGRCSLFLDEISTGLDAPHHQDAVVVLKPTMRTQALVKWTLSVIVA